MDRLDSNDNFAVAVVEKLRWLGADVLIHPR